MAEEKEPMKLEIKENEKGYALLLDNTRIKYVEDYKLNKSSAMENGTAELEVKMLVQFP